MDTGAVCGTPSLAGEALAREMPLGASSGADSVCDIAFDADNRFTLLHPDTVGRIEMDVLNQSGLEYDQRNILEFEEMVRIFLVDGLLQDEERAILIQKAEQYGLSDAVVENIIQIVSTRP